MMFLAKILQFLLNAFFCLNSCLILEVHPIAIVVNLMFYDRAILGELLQDERSCCGWESEYSYSSIV